MTQKKDDQSRFLPLLLVPILFMLFAAYCNTLYSPPSLDDFHSFIHDDKLYLRDLSFTSLLSLSKTQFGWGRWIPMMTFAINHKLGNSEVIHFHLTNIAIHFFVLLTVYSLVAQLLRIQRDRSGDEAAYNQLLALSVAGLWALNPVQTNAVTYLVQRMTSLQALFYVLSVSLYIRGRVQSMRKRRWRSGTLSYLGCILAAVCAFLSKQNSAVLPFMIIATEMWFFQPDLISVSWQRLKAMRKTLRFLLLIAFLCICVLAVMKLISAADYSNRHFNMLERLLTESRVVVWYMSLLLWPLPSRLSLEHDVTVSTSLLQPPTTLLSILFIALLVWQTIRWRQRFPLITYGILWFLLNLAIESTFINLELVFEHRLYLPSVGFFICIVLSAAKISRKMLSKISLRDFKIVTGCGFAILLSVLTLLTFIRNEAWENIITLNWDAAVKAPDNPRSHANLALAFFRTEQFDKAIAEGEAAIKLGREKHEEYAVAGNVIVGSYLSAGNFDEAIERGEELLKNRPENSNAGAIPELCINLAQAYLKSDRLAEAFSTALLGLKFVSQMHQPTNDYTHHKEMIVLCLGTILGRAQGRNVDLDGDGSVDPGSTQPESWIAQKMLALGERELGKELLNQAVAKNPEEIESRRLLEIVTREDEQNRIQKSKWSFHEKYVRQPCSSFNMCMGLAYLVREKRLPAPFMRLGEALLNYAMQLQPNSADAHLLKGWYHFERKEAAKAVLEARKALELDPEYAKAWLGLGFFLAEAKHSRDAAHAFQKTLELYPGYAQRQTIQALASELLKNETSSQSISLETTSGPGPAGAVQGESPPT